MKKPGDIRQRGRGVLVSIDSFPAGHNLICRIVVERAIIGLREPISKDAVVGLGGGGLTAVEVTAAVEFLRRDGEMRGKLSKVLLRDIACSDCDAHVRLDRVTGIHAAHIKDEGLT